VKLTCENDDLYGMLTFWDVPEGRYKDEILDSQKGNRKMML
jgi:hypothetical protein